MKTRLRGMPPITAGDHDELEMDCSTVEHGRMTHFSKLLVQQRRKSKACK
jgi:hypothetical protein